MATNLALDVKLLEEARIIGKHATKKAVVNEALAEYIQRRKQAEIIGLFNTINLGTDYDYKKQRQQP
ncbi:MAG: type II toxin-antitoxin system VapB family antitoxin [Deltaproteobacteria bacterium]|nr:type II toxin-antitoxin system VapB family antitoxin [Deltaproteobacteria bacterium]NCP02759.1 type II toxin-antitoxin system VapB family antitoxin [Deltaproteobacteria bacterium]NCP78508.1 type II toxin-antitoxin system VapB family antitoxin [Desulfuromonadales bacterium]